MELQNDLVDILQGEIRKNGITNLVISVSKVSVGKQTDCGLFNFSPSVKMNGISFNFSLAKKGWALAFHSSRGGGGGRKMGRGRRGPAFFFSVREKKSWAVAVSTCHRPRKPARERWA